ncbi:MAG: 2-amino-4-hydroxy-6-hydroxymethyldihydropteridine diphosphokinase [Muribaculaceae bacterium]|nr:2-amino-4-hydroxy-6-hydroxymethyldihydropteridine diphosphokinase [Muribaculaceae bacterium]
MRIHLNIGSNIGHRRSTLERAVAALSEALPGQMKVSEPIETPAWGYESANPYLNIGVMIDSDVDLPLQRLLELVLDIQNGISRQPHRDATGGYCDRIIDIDIIAVDDRIVQTPELTLPHPRMHLRRFVLEPMATLDPTWRHPVLGKTASEMMGEG